MQVLFVHGAFVRDGAWWWAPVARLLSAAGLESRAALLPSCGETGTPPTGVGPGLLDDASAVRACLDAGEPTVVVAHSYGGVVVAESAHPAIAHLVYISSFLPRIGESAAGLSATSTNPVPVTAAEDGSARVVVDEHFDNRFLQDVHDVDLRRGAHERLTAQSSAVFGTPVRAAAWEQIPSTYLVCAQDNSTPVEMQRTHAARATHRVDLPTGHHPMLSHPDLVCSAVLAAAPV